jgi:hypothetical protein
MDTDELKKALKLATGERYSLLVTANDKGLPHTTIVGNIVLLSEKKYW